MRIGIFGGDTAGRSIDDTIAGARIAHEQGFISFWLPQIFGAEALTTLAIVGREVPDIYLGTAVVPTYPRHPMVLAQQTLTVQQATGNRFMLGIGLSHQIVIEGMYGMSFDKPARHMREYLSILVPLLNGENVSFEGDTLTFRGAIDVKDASAPPVLLAALAPRMLELAGSVADGTITWMTGPATLESHIIPSINAAAEKAGKHTPAVAASLPICVTNDPDRARERAAKDFEVYGMLPSYRAMLDREGAEGPADVAIVGDEATVAKGIQRLADTGITDFAAAQFGTKDEHNATRDLLRSLL
jgi:5,10-methylenetetrahydromethanopterin reductase